MDTDEACLHKIGDKYQPSMSLNGFPQAMPRYYYNKVFAEVDKQNMIIDRYINTPVEVSLKGQKFASKFDQVMQRRSTLELNKSAGLTPFAPLPSSPRVSSFDRFKQLIDEIKDFE